MTTSKKHNFFSERHVRPSHLRYYPPRFRFDRCLGCCPLEITRTEERPTYELLNDPLDQASEREGLSALLRIPEILGQLSDRLSIGVRLELISLFFKDGFEFLVIGNDSIVHYSKLVCGVRAVRVGVHGRRLTVSGPTGVGHRSVIEKSLGEIDILAGVDEFPEGIDLANLLEDEDLIVRITINSDTCEATEASRVVGHQLRSRLCSI